jgi:transglutaminase-like putative cysteine protease
VIQVAELLHQEDLDVLPRGDSRLLDAKLALYVLDQEVAYDYSGPIADVRQRLMIVPRPRHGDQSRVAHRLDVAADTAMPDGVRQQVDRFGNAVVHVAADRVNESLQFGLRAVLRRDLTTEPVHDWPDPRPQLTRLTTPDAAIRKAAAGLRGGRDIGDVGDLADRVCALVRHEFTYRFGVTGVRTTAADAWAGRIGVCQDFAHVMIAICACLDVPARYVSGHLVGDGASHAWVEVCDPRRGEVISLDPTHDRRTDLRYVVTAVGRDYSDVAPTTGTYVSKGGRGSLRVKKRIRLAHVA